jgi:hypothetical protein
MPVKLNRGRSLSDNAVYRQRPSLSGRGASVYEDYFDFLNAGCVRESTAMSNSTSVILMFGSFLAGLAGFAWAASRMSGYPFGATFLAVVAVYALVLLTYACSRRIAQRLRGARAQRSSDVDRRRSSRKQ